MDKNEEFDQNARNFIEASTRNIENIELTIRDIEKDDVALGYEKSNQQI